MARNSFSQFTGLIKSRPPQLSDLRVAAKRILFGQNFLRRVEPKILVAIVNYDFSENADRLKGEFSKFFPTILIDSTSPKPPNSVDFTIANDYYPGQWNSSISYAIRENYDWLLFIASDVQIEEIEKLAKYATEISKRSEIGVYAPSLDMKSRCAFSLQYNRLSLGIREVGIVEGFCFFARTDLLAQIHPAPVENVFGWGLDILLCKAAYQNRKKVVIDDRVKIFHPSSNPTHEIDRVLAKQLSSQMLAEDQLSWVNEIQQQFQIKQFSPGATRSLEIGFGSALENYFDAQQCWGLDPLKHDEPRMLPMNMKRRGIPFRKNTFDSVSISESQLEKSQMGMFLVFTPEYKMMKETCRVLKQDGLLVFFFPSFKNWVINDSMIAGETPGGSVDEINKFVLGEFADKFKFVSWKKQEDMLWIGYRMC